MRRRRTLKAALTFLKGTEDLELGNQIDIAGAGTAIDVSSSPKMNYGCNQGCGTRHKVRVWRECFSTASSQHAKAINAGYDASSKGVVAGVDVGVGKTSYFGGGCGYAQTPVEWKRDQGSGSSTSAFGSLYAGGFFNRYFYGQGALIGGMNFYSTTRNIVFDTLLSNVNFKRVAKGKAYGLSVIFRKL